MAVALPAGQLEAHAPEPPAVGPTIEPIDPADFAVAIEHVEVGLGPWAARARDVGTAKDEPAWRWRRSSLAGAGLLRRRESAIPLSDLARHIAVRDNKAR
jgi:hypothetical protein